jgi:hypothetical protein
MQDVTGKVAVIVVNPGSGKRKLQAIEKGLIHFILRPRCPNLPLGRAPEAPTASATLSAIVGNETCYTFRGNRSRRVQVGFRPLIWVLPS